MRSVLKKKFKYSFILLFLNSFPQVVLSEGIDNTYLSLEKSVQSETNHKITSIGGFGIKDNKIGHINITVIGSDIIDDSVALDFGADATFDAGLIFFIGGGFLLRYNEGKQDIVASLYPEIGVLAIFSQKYGMNLTSKQYYNFYGQVENILSVSLLFSIR